MDTIDYTFICMFLNKFYGKSLLKSYQYFIITMPFDIYIGIFFTTILILVVSLFYV